MKEISPQSLRRAYFATLRDCPEIFDNRECYRALARSAWTRTNTTATRS